mgnify:CR=1 FL=1|tara:strand:- start:2980 stop:3354 length:375 start_codon:yes stop_codon:yes gene_type:complete
MSEDKKELYISSPLDFLETMIEETEKTLCHATTLIRDFSAANDIEKWVDYETPIVLFCEYFVSCHNLIKIAETVMETSERRDHEGAEHIIIEMAEFRLMQTCRGSMALCRLELQSNHNITLSVQ